MKLALEGLAVLVLLKIADGNLSRFGLAVVAVGFTWGLVEGFIKNRKAVR